MSDRINFPAPPDAEPTPKLPEPTTFIIRRVNPDYTAVDSGNGFTIETITLEADVVEMNEAGNILRFIRFYVHPTLGPWRRIVRCFNSWEDYEEVPVVEPSRILNVSNWGPTN